MTYLDDQGYEPDIYPPRAPPPPPRGRGIIGAMGFQSRRTQENQARLWSEYQERMQIYQRKLYERQIKELERAEKEQEKMAREHRTEQVKIAEQQAKLNESIAKQKYWNEELQKLERQQQEIQSARPKTSAQLATDKRQIETAKKNLSKATEDLDNFARTMEPLMKGLRGNRPADVDYKQYKENERQALERYRVSAAPPKTVPGYFGGFFGDSTNPEYTKYKQDEQTALDLYRGTSKATKAQGEPVRPGFKSTYGAYEAAREGVPIAEEKLAEQQEKLQRADEEFQRTRMMPLDERRLTAERGLSDEAAKQQAAQQVIDAYQKEGAELPQGSPAPQGGVSGGNVQRAIDPRQFPITPQPAPTQAQIPGSSAGGKGAIPIPIIGPILSAVGSALAGGKGGGGMMGPGQGQMSPRAPAGGFSPLSPSTVAPPLRFQPEQWSPLSPSPVAPPSQLQEPQMQAGQPPAIEQPAIGGVQKATYEGEPYTFATPGGPQSAAGYGRQEAADAPVVVGDSIALGLQREMGAQGDSKQSRPPAEVLAAIQSNPKMFSGRDVVLSSGASNDTKSVALLAKQIEALKAAGAKSISVMGVGDRKDFRGLNEQLGKIAGSMGARFLGPLQNLSKDHVHARSYRNIINQFRRSSPPPGAANDRGGPTAPRQRAAGGVQGQPPVFAGLEGIPRSISGGHAWQRFNNPFNVSLPIHGWHGGGSIAGIRGQPGYASFANPKIGYAAGVQRLKDYIDTKGLNTISALGTRYATDPNWPRGVSSLSGLGINTPLSTANPAQMAQLQKGILGQEIGPSSAKLFTGGGAPQVQMADSGGSRAARAPAGFARGSGAPFPTAQQTPQLPPQQAQQPQQKQVNPLAAGLSAIQPARPTVEMTEPSPIPPLQQPQKTPFIPLPFAPEKATSMDHLAQAGLLSGMSREQVMALMKKTMPNDQLPAWLMQQQQEQQGQQDAGE